MLQFKGNNETSETSSPCKYIHFRRPLSCREGVGRRVRVHPGPPGFITWTKPLHAAGRWGSLPVILGAAWAGPLPRSQLHSAVLGERTEGGAASSSLVAEWQAAGWTHAWQMAFQRVFRSHLGWVQLLQTTLPTKPEGLLPNKREVKWILSCFSGTAH